MESRVEGQMDSYLKNNNNNNYTNVMCEILE